MKHQLLIAGFLCACLSVTAQQVSLKEIRTASPTVLVAFFKDAYWTGPVWGEQWTNNQVTTTDLSLWTLNGQPVTAASRFVTEANAVDYHIYLQVPPLTNGMIYTLNTPYGNTNFVFDDTKIFCESIKVNQNGYSALSHTRYANFAIWLGDGGAKPIGGPLPNYTVFNQFTGEQIASGTLQTVTAAQPDSSSGDYVYRIDLSGVPEGGPYMISVKGYGCSYPFGVGGDFSRRLAYVAFRALFYNRCGCPIIEPYAWANIRPTPCHTDIYDSEGSNQSDTFPNGTVKKTQPELSVHGGYHDAGDADRRAYHLMVPMVLLTTYEAFPNLFTDKQFNIPDIFDADFNIIGSGNGIPDILDEAWWGTMLWTNLQFTPNEPSGAVAWGVNAAGYPAWGINYDQDTLLWGVQTNDVNSCGLAAGLFMHMARLVQPFNPELSANLQIRGDAAYNYVNSVPGWSMKTTHKLYYAIQKYLLTGDVTASNIIESLYTTTSGFTGSYEKQLGGALTDGGIWQASYFMSYILATNRPTDPNVVAYFKTQLQAAADHEVNWVNIGTYPSGWPASVNPTSYNFSQGYFTDGGQLGYPCLLQWALTGEQKYIDTVSQLMDYEQGLNPIGKCYMTGIGFDRTHNPEQRESAYAEYTEGWGGPQPGITVYGPGANGQTATANLQVPPANSLPRERKWMDDVGNSQWGEFTVEETEVFPAAIYPVLAQGGNWKPASGEPFLNPTASIQPNTNGWMVRFGGIPYQSYVLQSATAIGGPWVTVTGPVEADVTGMAQFTDTAMPTSATRFYRTQTAAPIY
ncbi:MAG TPA: glycoside hydrolase family 9 protein [Verrucomicrobiae bacterium]|nr:glycoside hydrolase family 9 protein [Verrucomicrobiae bacterium]